MSDFIKTLRKNKLEIPRRRAHILQLNLGRKCNLHCAHCHVDAGPGCTEEMDRKTVDRILALLDESPEIDTVDLTGGAPELNPYFHELVSSLAKKGRRVIDRCNLTVLLEKGQEDTAGLLARHKVEIFASLPCYTMENVDSQRGKSAYQKSVQALKLLNALGYGRENSGLVLNLVYNPLGAYLPGEQAALENDYRRVLFEEHGIVFNHLVVITNMPIRRFRGLLLQSGELDGYETLLRESFNPSAAQHVMCMEQVSVDYKGGLYDCDFNQALHIPVPGAKRDIWSISSFGEVDAAIAWGDHCYGCTAGFGSSCQGQTA